MLKEFGGGQFSTFKTALADLAVAKLAPIAAEMKRLTADPAHIDAVLADGSDRAARDRRRNHECRQGHRGIHPALTVVLPLFRARAPLVGRPDGVPA